MQAAPSSPAAVLHPTRIRSARMSPTILRCLRGCLSMQRTGYDQQLADRRSRHLYIPEFVVTDSIKCAGDSGQISFAINGNNAFLAKIFPSTPSFTIEWTQPRPACPWILPPRRLCTALFARSRSSRSSVMSMPTFRMEYRPLKFLTTSRTYRSQPPYINPISPPVRFPRMHRSKAPATRREIRHVLVYLEAGGGNKPALYEMWQGIYEGGPWTDSSNALWPDVTSNDLTPQGQGTSDAAGLPVAPLLANADEVIGTGTPSAPNGAIQHPIRFTLNHMLNYWVWPATQTAGTGSCTALREGLTFPRNRRFRNLQPSGKLHRVGSRWRNLPAEGFRGDSLLRPQVHKRPLSSPDSATMESFWLTMAIAAA
jgi:hypothetical protein